MKKYDFAFSLGAACAASQTLRYAGMQFASYPFDWTGGSDIVTRARLIANDFEHWLDRDRLELTDVLYGSLNASLYRDRVNGITYVHDFPAGCYLEDELPIVREKYRRRITRLIKGLESGKRVLAIYNEIPYRRPDTDAHILEAYGLLRKRFPKTEIDIVYFAEEPGFCEPREQALDDHVVKVLVDYHQMACGYVSLEANVGTMIEYLKSRVEVVDPRTPEQKIRFSAVDANREKDKWGTGITRWVNRRAFRLYRRLERFLSDRGVIPAMRRPIKLYPERGERRKSITTPDVSFTGEATQWRKMG